MPRNPEVRENEPLGEVRVGGGDNIRILELTAQKEIKEEGVFKNVETQLSQKEIEEILGSLGNLPFHIGRPEGTQAFGQKGEISDSDRPSHEAKVYIDPSVGGMPENTPNDKRPHNLTFEFDGDVWGAGISPHSAKNLEISQPMYESAKNWQEGPDKENIFVRVGFTPEKKLKIAGRKIEMISLVVKR